MKKLIAALATVAAFSAQAAETLTVAATAVPHAELLEFVKPQLAEQGVELNVKVFTDYVQPNIQVAEKRLDANFFQHQPYLDEFNKGKGTDLVSVAGVHIEPFGAYSSKVKSLDELPNGATVVIPNDATNGGRALLLLAENGVFKLRPGADHRATVADIVENPKRLRIVELEAASIARSLQDVDAGAITGNYAVPAGLNPLRDALARETEQSVYTVLVVVRRGDQDKPWAQRLARGYAHPEVKAFVEATFGGAVISGA